MRDGGPRSAELEAACALLLGDLSEVEYLMDRMPDKTLNEMRKWPIWKLRGSDKGASVAQT